MSALCQTQTLKRHPSSVDDCDAHYVQLTTSSSFCLSDEAFRERLSEMRRIIHGLLKAPIATMTQTAGTGANSGPGRIQYDAPRHCAYELYS